MPTNPTDGREVVRCYLDPSGIVYDESERYPFSSDPEYLTPAVAVPVGVYIGAYFALHAAREALAHHGLTETHSQVCAALDHLPEIPQ